VSSPSALYLDLKGNLYFVEDYRRIRKIDPSGKMTTILEHDQGITDIIVDEMGNLYVTDGSNHRVLKIDQAGIVSTIAGTKECGRISADDIGDGGKSTRALLDSPYGLAFDPEGNLYIAQARCVRNDFNRHHRRGQHHHLPGPGQFV
jgi:serine/threonine-protein kinase